MSVRAPQIGFWTMPPRLITGGRLFEILVPFDTPIPINVDARGLKLTDPATQRAASRFGRNLTFRRDAPQHLTFDLAR